MSNQRSGSKTTKAGLHILVALLFAFIPAWLVFSDRWLGLALALPWLDSIASSFPLLLQARLPSYFLLALLSIVCLFAWMLSTRWEAPSFIKPHILTATFNKPTPPGWQLRWGQISLAAALLLLGGSYILGIITRQIQGAGFLLGTSLFLLAWVLNEIPLKPAFKYIRRRLSLILRIAFFEISLVFLLRTLSFPSTWIGFAALLWLASGLLLLPDLRRVPVSIWLATLALVLFSVRINTWVSAVVFDEVYFFDAAMDILHNQTLMDGFRRLYDGEFPYLSILLQSAVMRIFGQDIFGLRISSVLFSAAAIGLLYEFYRLFIKFPLALIAGILLAGSSYLMTFGKIGYNNTQAFFALALTLLLAGWAVTTNRPLAYVTLGFGFGLCFYVYPVALFVPLIGVLFLALLRFPRSLITLRGWLLVAASAGVLILPVFIQSRYWPIRLTGLVSNDPNLLLDAPTLAGHFAVNYLQALFSPLYITEESHFISAAYLDPISAAFLLIGLAFSLLFFRKEPFVRFLTISFFLLLFLVGASHDRASPPNSRMLMLLPWFCLYPAISMYWLVEQLKAGQLLPRAQKFIYPLLIFMILLANLVQGYPLSWMRSAEWQLPENAFAWLLQELRQSRSDTQPPYQITILSPSLWQIDHFVKTKETQAIPDDQVSLAQLSLDRAVIPPAAAAQFDPAASIILLDPNMDSEWADALAPQLTALGKQPCQIRNYPGDAVLLRAWLSPELAAQLKACSK